MNLQTREAALTDATSIAHLHNESWKIAYKDIISNSYLSELSLEKRTAKWKQILTNPTGRVFVAVNGQKILGFCGSGKSRDENAIETTGEIYSIYIDPNETTKGLGTMLFERALESLREKGFSLVTLWVLEANAVGRRFYEKHGMKLDGDSKNFAVGDQSLKEVRYFKKL